VNVLRTCVRLLLTLATGAIVSAGCGPGSSDEAPAHLAVQPTALDFGSEDSARFIEVRNEGGGDLSYTVKVSAEVGGVVWLKVDPETGSVTRGSSRAVMVSAVNRDLLPPGAYLGELTVEAAGQQSVKVTVTTIAGAPVLSVDPGSEVDFGAASDTRVVVVKNAGKGKLQYSFNAPGKWLTYSPAVLPSLGNGESQSVTLSVDRALVPWYGPGEDELVIVSNGVTDSAHSSSVKLKVKVDVDPACSLDSDCAKAGYFCSVEGGLGACFKRKAPGAGCVAPNECATGFCASGVCCNEQCDQQCRSCSVPGKPGICGPSADGEACVDGLVCTVDDGCLGGDCVGGDPVDCSDLDGACVSAVCDEDAGGCKWTIDAGFCYVGGECYEDGAPMPGECKACDASFPELFSNKSDYESCEDEGNPCTADYCMEGVCAHEPDDGQVCDDGDKCTTGDLCAAGQCQGTSMDCDDGLPCSLDSCDYATGECKNEPTGPFCLIDGKCVAENVPASGPDAGCLKCAPGSSPYGWSPDNDGGGCDDGSECTAETFCNNGACVTLAPLCDDGNECTADECTGDQACVHTNLAGTTLCQGDGIECTDDVCKSGKCAHDVTVGTCLIDSVCWTDGDLSPESACRGCDAGQSQSAWLPANEGMPCDDGKWCWVDEVCTSGECAGNKKDCGDDDCNKGWCMEEQQECVTAPKADGGPCDDLDACTLAEGCLAGKCVGVEKDCSELVAETPCFDGKCIADDPVQPGKCAAVKRETGSPCDDGLGCTTDTTCDAGGVCGGGNALTPDFCTGQLALSGQCVKGLCVEPTGCQAVSSDDGTPCSLPNASAQCEQGGCVLIKCAETIYDDCNADLQDGCEVDLSNDLKHCGKCGNKCIYPNAWTKCDAGNCVSVGCKEGFTDCNLDAGDGCESATAVDPSNCGLCGKICDSPNPAKTGVCTDGGCSLVACESGKWNLDGNPANGCECTEGGKEFCNGIDDNCDGEVDEGFDLLHDMDNCGACGSICAVEGAEAFDCRNGHCMITKCPEGAVDADGEPEDGCEFVLFAIGDLWVDSVNGGGPGADGTEAKPFAAITDALAVASPSVTIHVLPGIYVGGFAVGKVGVVLVGAGADNTFVSAPQHGTGVEVAANEVVLRGLGIVGGQYGIRVTGEPAEPLDTVIISDVTVSGQAGNPAGGTADKVRAAGIMASYVNKLSVLSSTISGVQGAKPQVSLDGGEAVGLDCVWCSDLVVAGNLFSQMAGGKGLGPSQTGHSGGAATAVALQSCEGVLLAGNEIWSILGGSGADKSGYSNGGTGGLAAGVSLSSSTVVDLLGNALASIAGGKGGTSGDNKGAPDQPGFGLHLDAESISAQVGLNNTLDGEPIVHLYGADGVSIKGLQLVGAGNPTNLGKVSVYQSKDVSISECNLANSVGEAGRWDSLAGRQGVGIRVEGCDGCLVNGNSVADIVGGQGGYGKNNGGPAAQGVGILLDGCSACSVEGNSVGSVEGGKGGGPTNVSQYAGLAGPASGFKIVDSAGTKFSNNLVRTVRRRWGKQGVAVRATCVEVGKGSPLTVQHLTCRDVGLGTYVADGSGVALASDADSQVHVQNSIIADATGPCLDGLASNTGLLSATYSDLFNCTAGASQDAIVGTGCLELDPLFVNASGGNLHVEATSPCIDSGNPASQCSDEPVPNGCRVNIGAYGGTAEATSDPDAPHCAVCP